MRNVGYSTTCSGFSAKYGRAKEIAETGRPQIRRPDRDELLTIKAGRFPYDDLMAKASAELKIVDDSFASSKLPDEPDTEQIERWAVEIRKEWYSNAWHS